MELFNGTENEPLTGNDGGKSCNEDAKHGLDCNQIKSFISMCYGILRAVNGPNWRGIY
jgi:hypothetical protein